MALKSFSSDLLKDRTLTTEEDYVVKWSALSLFSGGAETVCSSLHHILRLTPFAQSVSAFYSFFLAMTISPDVQKKAQAEIDTIVGPDRLPSFADRASLPYIEAIVKEIFRWNVVLPCSMCISFIIIFI
jgi:hypothetical protein